MLCDIMAMTELTRGLNINIINLLILNPQSSMEGDRAAMSLLHCFSAAFSLQEAVSL